MPFALRRTTDVGTSTSDAARSADERLALTSEHDAVAAPRKGSIDWSSFRQSDWDAAVLDAAASDWHARAIQEFHSLALFTQLASQLHLLGAPLDWSGAFARMIADEVRHTDLCLRMCEALGRPTAPSIDERALHLTSAAAPAAHVRGVILAAFAIGETLSGRMFRRALRAATVPLARDVVAAILVDETFHGELGWELSALSMREVAEDERRATAATFGELFRHYAELCGADRGERWAASEPEATGHPNFGTLTDAGYARAFFDGMNEDVVPGLVAIGLTEAETAWAETRAAIAAALLPKAPLLEPK